jgi:hypothetical protein
MDAFDTATLTATLAPIAPSDAPIRCGIDSVEIARIERLLAETPVAELTKLFTARELADAGDGAVVSRASRLDMRRRKRA